MSIVQLLLGNIGVAGGGLNALREEPNVQGASDMALLVFDFPGYLKWPLEGTMPDLATWLSHETAPAGYYTNKPKFFISSLKEWYGDNATVENDYGYDWLPKVPVDGLNYTTMGTFHRMTEGSLKGMFVWVQNPAHSEPNHNYTVSAMSNLDWLVAVDTQMTETAEF